MNRLDLLYQSEVWHDAGGRELRISSMSARHRFNTARMLLRQSRIYAHSEVLRTLMGPWPNGEIAQDSLEMEIGFIEQNPEGWMRSTSLWQALVQGLSELPTKDCDPKLSFEFKVRKVAGRVKGLVS